MYIYCIYIYIYIHTHIQGSFGAVYRCSRELNGVTQTSDFAVKVVIEYYYVIDVFEYYNYSFMVELNCCIYWSSIYIYIYIVHTEIYTEI